jgi:hypothetical protein
MSFGVEKESGSDVGHKEGRESHPVKRCSYLASRSGWRSTIAAFGMKF